MLVGVRMSIADSDKTVISRFVDLPPPRQLHGMLRGCVLVRMQGREAGCILHRRIPSVRVSIAAARTCLGCATIYERNPLSRGPEMRRARRGRIREKFRDEVVPRLGV